MDKKDIIKRFSRFAFSYKGDVQLKIGKMLIDMLNGDFSEILEVGCGKGGTTRLIREKFPKAKIVSLDISEKMVFLAKDIPGVFFIVADGENVWFRKKFDLVISNTSFQWFENVKNAVFLYKSILNKNGILLFSIFGYKTLWELRDALSELFKKNIKTRSSYFMKKEEIEVLLGKEFTIKEEVVEKIYNSLMELLYSIRYAGGLNEKYIWTRGMVKRLDEIYKGKFGEIKATYQVFLCKSHKIQ